MGKTLRAVLSKLVVYSNLEPLRGANEKGPLTLDKRYNR